MVERTASLHPTALNVLLGDTRDIGTLNSEFFLATPINEHWGIQPGSHISLLKCRAQTRSSMVDGVFAPLEIWGMLSATCRLTPPNRLQLSTWYQSASGL